ncbi:MAG: hypothetical protein PF542_03145 [Nanoarchaeota archaeon]|jgi:hypothetical protein|nr:hypothetical protein [Nanoarchaeota archaeon]
MKFKKTIIFTLLSTLFINIASAYGEMTGTFIGGFYIDTQIIGAGLFFLLFFGALVFVTRKAKLFTSEMTRIIVSMILAIFGVYGLFKLGIDFEKIIFDIGIQDFMMNNFPIILAVVLIFAMLKWGPGIVMMLAGGIFFIAGIAGSWNEDIVYNWEYAMLIGAGLFMFGLMLYKKLHKWRPAGFTMMQGRKIFTSIRKLERKIRKLQKEFKRALRKGDLDKTEKLKKQLEYLEKRLQALKDEQNKINTEEDKIIQRISRPIRRSNSQDVINRYGIYSREIQGIMARYNKKIPHSKSSNPQEVDDSKRYSRLIRGMKRLETIATRGGFRESLR